MCRICGRFIKCLFDSMPSRVPVASKRAISTVSRPATRPCGAAPYASSRQSLRQALDLDAKTSSSLPPTFLLPLRSRLHQASVQHAETSPLLQQQKPPEIPPQATGVQRPDSATPETSSTSVADSVPSAPGQPLVLSDSLQRLLPYLSAQKPHYITAHIHRFPYLLTAGDTLRLPFHMHRVSPGDVLRLNRASILGSRDYTLKAGTANTETYDKKRTGEPNYLDERLFECRVRVLGVDSGPMVLKEKTKRRQRRVKTVRSKHRYTVLKVMEVRVKSLEELKASPGTLLLGS